MRILIAPDSFKGSLSSIEASSIMKKACLKIFPDAKIILFPLADGGEGTVEVLKRILGGTLKTEEVFDHLKRKIKAQWLKNKNCGFIEMASSAGLILLKEKEKNPLKTTTFGVGQLIKKAVASKCKKIYIGIGGSSTNDGGIGALTALGVKFFKKNGRLIYPGAGKDLNDIEKIDFSGIPSEILSAEFVILSDVKNPLYGKNGAAYIYAPQKGAEAEMVSFLDKGLRNYAAVIKKCTGKNISEIPGAGAAGGIGAGLLTFLNAKIVSGIETILRMGNFEKKLQNADLLLTGEGKIDSQIKYGKTLGVLFKLCEKYQIPTIAFAGIIEENVYTLIKNPLITPVSIVPGIVDSDYAMKNASNFLRIKVEQMLKGIGVRS